MNVLHFASIQLHGATSGKAPEYILVEKCLFPVSAGNPDDDIGRRAKLDEFRKMEKKLLRRHRKAVAAHDEKKARATTRALLGSKAFLVVLCDRCV